MTYAAAIEFLYDLQLFGAIFGLENTQRLAALAGHPQNKLRFIHVAGTNGKGSTCAMLENIYRAAGWRVGLFTSPHLVSFRERIQIDRELISEDAVAQSVPAMQRLLKEFPRDHHPTFFEVVTVMALRHFAEHECDLVIWETGLGGRLDATNIVTPLASVITNVQFDHQKWLGNSLPVIAAEKAGIIKSNTPVITAVDADESFAVVEKMAAQKNAPLYRVTESDGQTPFLNSLALPLAGPHQKLNAALALKTVEVLHQDIAVSANAVRCGLETVRWPGRLQTLRTSRGQTIVLDGAHNPSAMAALLEALAAIFPKQTPTILVGIMRDKDLPALCRQLADFADRIIAVPIDSPRAARPEEIVGAFAEASPAAKISQALSLRDALDQVADDRLVVITGSLYLVGEALESFETPGNQSHERALNNWQAVQPAGSA
jgi:dihydrofolate synthase/folylpolyglutamate synthase